MKRLVFLIIISLTCLTAKAGDVQFASNSCSSCSSLSKAFTSNNGLHHTLMVEVGYRGGLNAPTTISDTAGNIYTLAEHFGISQGLGQFLGEDFFYTCSSVSGPNTVSVFSGIFTQTRISIIIKEVSGLATSSCLIQNDTGSTGTCTGGCGSVATTQSIITTVTNEYLESFIWEEALTTAPTASPYTVITSASTSASVMTDTDSVAPTISSNNNIYTFAGSTGSFMSRNFGFSPTQTFGNSYVPPIYF